MRELGLDLSDRTPKRLTDQLAEQADIVITMGCGDQCPTSQSSATSTGTSPTQTASRSNKSERSATTSPAASNT
jgi:arsenate reductase (thioredoxin)